MVQLLPVLHLIIPLNQHMCMYKVSIIIISINYCLFTGPPGSVSNLQGYQLDYCCMFISWDPPYTLPGLTVQYIISVGTEQHELNSTNYTYCPLNLTNKEYQFNITTSNAVGNGSTSNITIGFQSSKIILSHSNYTCIIQILNFWPVIKNLIA